MINSKKLPHLYFIFCYLIFFLGFFLNEDSAGGGALDFYLHELNNIIIFSEDIIRSLTDIEYESSRTPLFLILNAFNPFLDSEFSIRFSNFIFNLSIPILFICVLKIKYKDIDDNQVYLIASLLLLSPYFRTTSFWAHQENLPIFFLLCTFILYFKYIKKKNNLIFSQKLPWIFCIAVIASLSFYSDQKYLFLSLIIFLKLFLDEKKFENKLIIFLLFFLTSLPAIYLFYLWGGVLPKESLSRIGIFLPNVSNTILLIGFTLIPLIINILINKGFKFFLPKNYIEIVVFSIFFIFSILTVPDLTYPLGRGVIVKFFYFLITFMNLDIFLVNILYAIATSFFVIFFIKIFELNIYNIFFILFFLLILLFVNLPFQEYFDPLITILVFLLFNFKKGIDILNLHNLKIYNIFYWCFLIFSIFYYLNINFAQKVI